MCCYNEKSTNANGDAINETTDRTKEPTDAQMDSAMVVLDSIYDSENYTGEGEVNESEN